MRRVPVGEGAREGEQAPGRAGDCREGWMQRATGASSAGCAVRGAIGSVGLGRDDVLLTLPRLGLPCPGSGGHTNSEPDWDPR